MMPRRRSAGLTPALAVIFALVGMLPAAAAANVPPVIERSIPGVESWQRWGSGEMRWLGFELYRATLWVATERVQQEMPAAEGVQQATAVLDVSPHALVLQYRRAIKASRLVQVSLDEMRQLGIAEADLRRWEGDLQRVFRDVAVGDSITGVHHPGVGARFFHGGEPTGEIADPNFARAFFAIWLDPRTSAPRLRESLLRSPRNALNSGQAGLIVQPLASGGT